MKTRSFNHLFRTTRDPFVAVLLFSSSAMLLYEHLHKSGTNVFAAQLDF